MMRRTNKTVAAIPTINQRRADMHRLYPSDDENSHPPTVQTQRQDRNRRRYVPRRAAVSPAMLAADEGPGGRSTGSVGGSA
jgi:hypothetical protein